MKYMIKIVFDDDPNYNRVEAHFGNNYDEWVYEYYDSDDMNAVKRAIVRAAAEIGKSK